MIVLLLRNIDQTLGLCNGIRLIITKMGRYVLGGKVVYGSHIGEKVFNPRLSLTSSDLRIPFMFSRSANVYLSSPVFSHGQLYVAISKVISRDGFKILITDEDGDHTNDTSNFVYNEVFCNV
ncbi:PIF1 helicase, putative [Medicago truncatula]|uniref:PIF1 helicase, putative n=1 Tax=Medicago truncatula TaxID=3880 RepID=G7LBV5_MEDTR|nr:PIF1 helicase, putative [Medicago truncatula]